MPIYEYVCTACGLSGVIYSIAGQGPSVCDRCGSPMPKALSTPAIVFKGSGWAKKDHRDAVRAKTSTLSAADGDGSTTPAAGDSGSGAGAGAGRPRPPGDPPARRPPGRPRPPGGLAGKTPAVAGSSTGAARASSKGEQLARRGLIRPAGERGPRTWHDRVCRFASGSEPSSVGSGGWQRSAAS